MNQAVVNRILDAQNQLYTNNLLAEEYKEVHEAFLEMLDELSEDQRNTLMDYLGVCIQMHLKMLEAVIEKK